MSYLNVESSVSNLLVPCHLQEVLRVLLNTAARGISRRLVGNHEDMCLWALESLFLSLHQGPKPWTVLVWDAEVTQVEVLIAGTQVQIPIFIDIVIMTDRINIPFCF